MLPHKHYQEEAFIQKTSELKQRFEVGVTCSLFLSQAEQKNVPMDGLPHFISQAWDSIRQQKELNLPDQRAMVANYRCTELKEEAISLVKQPIIELQTLSDRGVVENFNEHCLEVLKKSGDYYAEVAKQYDREVFKKIQKELFDHVLQSLYLCFDSQLKMLS